jgi:hypothetical protein
MAMEKEKARMGKAEREKGKRGEIEVARALRAIWPEARTKRAGGESASQDRGRDLLGTPGWCWQVKRRERLNVSEALKECASAAVFGDRGQEVPVVAHRRRGEAWVASLPLHALIRLLACWASTKKIKQSNPEKPGFGDCGEYL